MALEGRHSQRDNGKSQTRDMKSGPVGVPRDFVMGSLSIKATALKQLELSSRASAEDPELGSFCSQPPAERLVWSLTLRCLWRGCLK